MKKCQNYAEKHDEVSKKSCKNLLQSDLCRTCMSTSNLKPIFSNSENEQMSEKLKVVTSLQIRRNDELSQKICNKCLQIINKTLEFRIQCKQTEETLISLLSKNTKSEAKNNPVQYSITEVNVKCIKNQNDFEKSDIETEVKLFTSDVAILTKAVLDIDPCENLCFEENQKTFERDSQNNREKGTSFIRDIKIKNSKKASKPKKNPPKTSAERQRKYRERIKLLHTDKLKTVPAKNTDEVTHRNEIEDLQEKKIKLPSERRPYTSAPGVSPPYSCHCGKQFTVRSSYVTHFRFHNSYFVCEECGKICKNNFILQQHKRAKHGLDKIHKCGRCDYSAATKDSLTVHERRHRGERPYVCDHCAVGFYTRRTLVQHIGVHSPDTIQCPICPKRLRSLRLLSNHRASVHGKRYIYQCPSCPKSFRDRKYVRRHLAAVHRTPREQQPDIEKYLLSVT